MSVNLTSLLWDLPGTRGFLQVVGQDLRNSRSLWILFPDGVDIRGFEDTLLHYLETDCFLRVQSVDLGTAGETMPFEVLQEALGLQEAQDGIRSLEDLIEQKYTPEVLLLRSFDELASAAKQLWSRDVARWAEASRRVAEPRSVCIVVPACSIELPLPTQDVRLAIREWRGIPSALEMRLICRIVSCSADPLSSWRECLVASLAGGDLALGEHLWDVVTRPISDIVSRLVAFAVERGWDQEEAKGIWNGRHLSSGIGLDAFPRERDYHLWSRGWLVCTPEYGEEIHSALLALMGDEKEIQHRIWRAQATLLLPAIDDVRLSICEYLERRHGEGWHGLKGQEEAGPYVELGPLEIILRKRPKLGWERQQWLGIVSLAREIRNHLAHYTPVSFDEFAEFWQLSAKVRRMGKYGIAA